MKSIAYSIPDDRIHEVTKYIIELGGTVLSVESAELEDEDDEVTHDLYFGENIKRLIRAFKKK
jgi:hypothetical protein